MSIWIGPMKRHVDGHKELTNYNEIIKLTAPKLVYIPLFNFNSTQVELLVKEGDRVFVNSKIAIRNDNMIVPMFSPVSGTVKGVLKMMHSLLKPLDHLIIENDGLYEETRVFEPIDWQLATREELIDYMMNAGIVGCGGAGFPTYIKYKFATNIHTLLINGVECEPYITADYRMMETHLDDLVTGTLAMLKMSQAEKAIIAIKATKKDLITKVSEAFASNSQVSVKAVPDVYPMGWERTLVYQVFKKRYDKLPGEVGVVVNNTSTAIAFAQALSGKPIIEKMITVSGDGIDKPANVLAVVGMKAADIVEQLGGYTAEEISLIAGGPMMGKTITSDQFVTTPYTNSLTILKTKPLDPIACLRCGNCNDTCPAGLLPVRINEAEKTKNVDLIVKLNTEACIECGLCTYVCPSKLDVTEGIRRAKRALTLRK